MSDKTSDKNVVTEEDIKVLKNIEKLRRIEFKHCVTNREMKALQNILAEREQILKENLDNKQDIKDFQNALNEENLRCANYAIENNELKKRIKELEELVAKLKTVDYMFRIDSYSNRYDMRRIYFEWLDSIPKQAVIDKIEELKEFRTALPVGHLKDAQIKVLQELLQESEDK